MLDTLQPGHYWKTPFYWEPGCRLPPSRVKLRFEPASDAWLRPAIAAVMSTSIDASDVYTVARIGADAAAQEIFDLLAQYFERPPDWWRLARNDGGSPVGFVLPVLFKEERFWKEGRPQGTILYMGVLPGVRGHGYGLELVDEATQVFVEANCWRIFCDTGSDNARMVTALRTAGYIERTPWQRPLA